MLKEFRDFAMKGNVLDMAVGIIIGGAFGTIIQSLVKDVLMPPIGLLLGGIDFSNIFLTLKAGTPAGPVREPGGRPDRGRGVDQCRPVHQRRDQLPDRGVGGVHAGQGLQHRQEERSGGARCPPEPPRQELLLAEIRDLLEGEVTEKVQDSRLQIEDPPTRHGGELLFGRGAELCGLAFGERSAVRPGTGCRCVHDPGRAAAFGRLRVAAAGAGEDAVDGVRSAAVDGRRRAGRRGRCRTSWLVRLRPRSLRRGRPHRPPAPHRAGRGEPRSAVLHLQGRHLRPSPDGAPAPSGGSRRAGPAAGRRQQPRRPRPHHCGARRAPPHRGPHLQPVRQPHVARARLRGRLSRVNHRMHNKIFVSDLVRWPW